MSLKRCRQNCFVVYRFADTVCLFLCSVFKNFCQYMGGARAQAYTCICARYFVCVCACMRAYVCMHACARASMHACMHVLCVYVCVHPHVCVCVCV